MSDIQRRKTAAFVEVALDALEAAERLGADCVSEHGRHVIRKAHEELSYSYHLTRDIWPWAVSWPRAFESVGEEVPFSPSQRSALERVRRQLDGLEKAA